MLKASLPGIDRILHIGQIAIAYSPNALLL
jgi:hypothetical protein